MSSLSYNSTKFITGLRAYAALGVFLIHSGGFGLRQFSIYTNRIVDFGKYGVIVFFVVSAFTISMSIEREKSFSFLKYIIKRFFRVAPLYYIALIVAFLFGGNSYYSEQFKVNTDIFTLLFHVTFFNWISIKHQNNLIGVEWSVPIEFLYYLVIPYLLLLFRNKKGSVLVVLIIAAITSSISYLFYHQSAFSDEAFHWSIVKYFFSFIFGIFVYLIFSSSDFFEKFEYPNLLIVSTLVGLLVYIILGFQYPDMFATLIVGLLILICKKKTRISSLLFENRVIIYLGEISYSIYLVHMLLFHHAAKKIELFSNPYIVLIATLFISTLTYYFVEKPFISLGKKIFKEKK